MLKQLFNAGALFSTRLKKCWEFIIIGKLLAFPIRHFDLLQKICLVAYEANVAIFRSVVVNAS